MDLRRDAEVEVQQPSPLTPEQVWRAVESASFGVLCYVTPEGAPRSSGVVYKTTGRKLIVAVEPGGWKARHIAMDGRISMTVSVRRGGLLSLVFPIPPATITFHGTATVHEAGSIGARAAMKHLSGFVPSERRDLAAIVEVVPSGTFVTFGIGVPLMRMRSTKARRRVAVG